MRRSVPAAFDLVIRGRALRAGGLERVSIGVAGGRIARVGRRLDGDRVQDFGDRLLLPAATDLHVHFRDPGHPAKEDFGTGTLAAAFGGVTAVVDMPNTSPPTSTPAAFEAKLAAAAAKAHVDFGLYAGLTDEPQSARLLRRATALKGYLGASTGDLLVRNEAAVRAALAEQARTGKLVAFHAEDAACLEAHAAAERHRVDPAVWSDARPAGCEAESIAKLARLRPAGARAHVAHLSSAAGLAALRPGMTSEVTPHHLLATRDDLAKDGRWKMNPPLRSRRDQAALWAALRDGRIDCVASDHAPHLPEEKARGVWDAPAGVPGVETLLPLMLAQSRRRRIPLARLVEACCARPAQLGGFAKGRLAPGYDADLLVVDLAAEEHVRADRLHSRCGWSPYEGMPAIFPTHVMLRGEWLIAERALVGRAGAGRFLEGGPRKSAAKPRGP